jgi:hypothetical protein
MRDPIVYGFPRSTYVNIIRLILTDKDVAYSFHDLEPVMGQREHLALHPFPVRSWHDDDGLRTARSPPTLTRRLADRLT